MSGGVHGFNTHANRFVLEVAAYDDAPTVSILAFGRTVTR